MVSRLRREWIGLLLLAVSIGFQAVTLVPECAIGVWPPNDALLHLVLTERLDSSLERGEPLLDPWVSEWALGYPVWRSYQPLPHLAAVVVQRLAGSVPNAVTFATWQYFLLVLLPASIYLGCRLLGLGPGAAGLTSLLCWLPSATGEFGRYGLGYGATTFRGSGLYTQLFALHALLPTLGLVARALDRNSGRTLAAVALAVTSLSHIVFGYVAFVSSAALAMLGTDCCRRLARLPRVVVPAILFLLWFLVPLFAMRDQVNHSRWEDPHKFDSFGAGVILDELASGRLFDAGRAPGLSLLLAGGVLAAAWLAGRDRVARRLLGLSTLWLLLWFGRATWGHLLHLAAVPAEFHLHRLQAAFEILILGTAAHGVAGGLGRMRPWPRAIAALLLILGLQPAVQERAMYLRYNAAWGQENLRQIAAELPELNAALDDIDTLLAPSPGRVSAGKAATWGRDFKIGSLAAHSFLTRRHIDQVSFLYHSMSLTSEVMVLRDEDDPGHDVAFGVRAVLAPADRTMPAHLQLRSVHGRFAVYESSAEGYFGLVDIVARAPADREDDYARNAAWLRDPYLQRGLVVALEPTVDLTVARDLPLVAPDEPLPPAPASALRPRGRFISQAREGETYRAQVLMERPAAVLVKLTWHPDLRATVDRQPAELLRVTPGFGAVAVPAGVHTVQIQYAPGPLRGVLLLLAGGLLLALPRIQRSALVGRAEERLAAMLRGCSARLASRRAVTGLLLVAASVLAFRPLLRGRLIDGHDALEYPTRQVEFLQTLTDRHIPPVWAPDLGSGHGQPLFAYAPPLIYAIALPLQLLGCGLTDALQVSLAGLHLLGVIAVYRFSRRRYRRTAALGAAIAWAFGPYVALDAFVRSAFAESSAVAVAPIALLAVARQLDRPSRSRLAAAGAAVALILLAHNAAALLLIPFLAGFILLAAPNFRAAIHAGLAVGFGLALSAWFWLPALLDKRHVKVDLLREGFLSWQEHILAPWQLLWSPWGYGLSLPGTGDGMSFQLGPLHLLLAGIGVVICLRRDRAHRGETLALAGGAIAGALLATDLAWFLWTRIETLQFMAYPWRALLLPGLTLPLLAGRALAAMPQRAQWLVIAGLVLTGLGRTEPGGYRQVDDRTLTPQQIGRLGLNTTTREEYEPRWVTTRPPYQESWLRCTQTDCEVTTLHTSAAVQRHRVRLDVGDTLEARTFYYPGWTATVDGKELPIQPTPVRGTIGFELPAGDHEVTLRLHPTPARRLGNLVSVGALIGLLINLNRRPRKAPESAPRDGVPRAADGPRRRPRPGRRSGPRRGR